VFLIKRLLILMHLVVDTLGIPSLSQSLLCVSPPNNRPLRSPPPPFPWKLGLRHTVRFERTRRSTPRRLPTTTLSEKQTAMLQHKCPDSETCATTSTPKIPLHPIFSTPTTHCRYTIPYRGWSPPMIVARYTTQPLWPHQTRCSALTLKQNQHVSALRSALPAPPLLPPCKAKKLVENPDRQRSAVLCSCRRL